MIPFLGETLLAGGGAIAQYFGQKETNATNVNIAREANAQSQANAREQMAFQERMSNTEYQRAAEDLTAAGFNKMLALKGGASSPAGASGQTTAAEVKNPFEGLSTAAKDSIMMRQAMLRQQKELGLMDAQKKSQEASARYSDAAARKADVEAKVATKGIPEAEIKNDLYNMARPYVDKLKEAERVNSKPDSQRAVDRAIKMKLKYEQDRFNFGGPR